MTNAAARMVEQAGQPALTIVGRASAGLGALGLASVFVGLGASPNAGWIEPLRVLTHLTMLPLAADLPPPRRGRAMGFAWLALDTVVSIALINGVALPLGMALRLGTHVLAAGLRQG